MTDKWIAIIVPDTFGVMVVGRYLKRCKVALVINQPESMQRWQGHSFSEVRVVNEAMKQTDLYKFLTRHIPSARSDMPSKTPKLEAVRTTCISCKATQYVYCYAYSALVGKVVKCNHCNCEIPIQIKCADYQA